MNRRIATLATLFAAGAFVAAGTPTTTVRTSSDTLLTQKGCGADKDKAAASCSADKMKADKDKKAASCSADKMKDKKKVDSKDKKQASCSADKMKDKKDASCGKGSCGSAK